jgi:hypothetical protein
MKQQITGLRIVATRELIEQIRQFAISLNRPEIIVKDWTALDAEREVRSLIREWEKENEAS